MDDGLKQRLVGAAVLIALLVIFLPVLFDRNRVQPVDTTSQIPPMPHLPIKPIAPAQTPVMEEADQAPPPDKQFIPDDTKPVKAQEPTPPKLNAKGVPITYTLQLASYKSAAPAQKLQAELAAKGFTAYVRDIKTANGVISRVYVGPKLDKKTLLEAKRQLDETYKLNAILLEFTPS